MNTSKSFEPQFQELEAPVYTLKECNDIVSVVANCLKHCNDNPMLTDIEDYVERFTFIRKETREHILSTILSSVGFDE